MVLWHSLLILNPTKTEILFVSEGPSTTLRVTRQKDCSRWRDFPIPKTNSVHFQNKKLRSFGLTDFSDFKQTSYPTSMNWILTDLIFVLINNK